jgi:hypothetical protein
MKRCGTLAAQIKLTWSFFTFAETQNTLHHLRFGVMMSLVSRLLLWSTFLVQSFHASARPQPVDLQLHDRQATDATGRPCGLLFDSIKDELSKGLFPLFFAADVYTCLISVPFLPAVAVRFLDYYNTTLQFQSTLAFLRDPPPGYQQPAVDVVAELERIQQNVLAGSYTKQYNFEVDVQKVVRAIHDSHVELVAGVLAPFTFASPFDIVSASLDGQALPKPYLKCMSIPPTSVCVCAKYLFRF